MAVALDPVERERLVAGLADMLLRRDPVLSKQAGDMLTELSATMPEAHDLVRLHHHHDGRIGRRSMMRPALRVDLAALHRACAESHAIGFSYKDLNGQETSRRVLPLAIVHPDHGIKLVAWCTLRDAPRTFFVHSMTDMQVDPERFPEKRADLIAAVVSDIDARYA
ncbi:WYL domain-containing protein [Thalassococcus sp. CAU 1522]|uniref:WYL domain-containing protein n=1 Tax=Thalassococcus arenae TaxID=2851652 RepID=A0ABS6N651_9RHOB|nr:WYL domain-containing protein [Thalassococcus arenae]MBV2359500.1 WYL domain-containing protein [Thalassococcus arenae]